MKTTQENSIQHTDESNTLLPYTFWTVVAIMNSDENNQFHWNAPSLSIAPGVPAIQQYVLCVVVN